MMSRSRFLNGLLWCVLLVATGCEKVEKRRPGEQFLLERVQDVAVVQIYADGFDKLPLDKKKLAYYLYRAAVAGRDIATDQTNRYALEIRSMMEEIFLHRDGLPRELQSKIEEYTKLLWIHGAQYNMRTFDKILPKFIFSELVEAANYAVDHGANIAIAEHESLLDKLERLRKPMFDQSFQPFCTNRSPDVSEDILTASANNLYENVTLDEIEHFPEQYPLNAKVIKVDGVIVELPYRTGIDKIPPGLYARRLGNVVHYLQKAQLYADENQRRALGFLIDYFQTGDPASFRNYNIAWVADDPVVDTINGFIEVYKDARSVKGSYEGIVLFRDAAGTALMKKLAENAAAYEEKAPWAGEFKRKHFNFAIANAMNALALTGDGGPISWSGINLPNAQEIREHYGSKSFLLSNVIQAREGVMGDIAADEFLYNSKEKALLKEFGASTSLAFVAMHEVLGHASGKVSPDLDADPSSYLREYYSTIEEARADLVALWNIADPLSHKLGIIDDPRGVEALYRSYAMTALTQLSRVPNAERLQEDHMRGHQMIVEYIAKNSKAIKLVRQAGKSYQIVADIEGMRNAIGKLLSEVMRIKATGDYEAAKNLVETYGTNFDHAVRDEIVQRAIEVGYPNFVANVTPMLEAITNADGEIETVKLVYPKDLTKEMLAFREQDQPNVAKSVPRQSADSGPINPNGERKL